MNRIKKLCILNRALSQKDIEALTYIIEKVSKISTVTLMLADVLNDKNEIQHELQRSAIRLVTDITKSVKSLKKKDDLISELLSLVALLDVAGSSGQLSRMNTELLANEIVDLSEIINTIDWHIGRKYLDGGMFAGEPTRDIFTPEPMFTRTKSYQRHEMDTNEGEQNQKGTGPVRHGTVTLKDNVSKNRIQYKERVQEIQKDRRATILGLVQKKDRITVKDVANIIKDCSEKTIQRELLALVKQGVLKKEGERRWSTYSLA